ncbi:hypothetical protein N7G274_005126 [Stereocaulon virgatum]|uniref:Uncharacterized protein n=1 Tax=Stereocaulon virgatum TaxID=373712 RepID=A0ABR4A8C0_9LECA
MPGPRTPHTLKLEPTKRQFFQWYFVERMTITEVKERMDELSKYLNRPAGEDFVASVSEWAGRRRYWNSQCATRWNIKDKDRGNLNLAMPADIAHLSLWRKGCEDVGNWRTIPQYDYHRTRLPSASGSVRAIRNDNALDQTSESGHWEDLYDWGLIRESDSGDGSRKPSVSSASSVNSYTFMSEYATSTSYSATTTEDDSLPKSYYDPNTDMHPSQAFHYDDNTEPRGLDGQSTSSQQVMHATAMPRPYFGPGYTPPQKSTSYLRESAAPYIGLQGNIPPLPMTLPQQDQPLQSCPLQYQDIHPAEFPDSYRYLGSNPALSSAAPSLEHQLQRSQSCRK